MSVRNLVHTPADAAQERVLYAERAQTWPGVTWGIPRLDRRLIPMHPGDMVVLCGRPGHAKSSVLAYLARTDALRIRDGGIDEQCVVYVSWEQVTEEIDGLFHLEGDTFTATDVVRGNVDMEQVRRGAIARARLPVWLIGESAVRDDPTPTMDVDAVARAVTLIKDEWGKEVTLLCADYLQLIPVKRGMDMVAEVTYAAGLLKRLAKALRCPVVVAVQARREVDDRRVKIPELRDGQWACLAGDCTVRSRWNGEAVSVEEIWRRSLDGFPVTSLVENTLQMKPAVISAIRKNPPEPIYRVSCGNYGTIRTNNRHKFYTPYGWRELQDLGKGDWIALSKKELCHLIWQRISEIVPDGFENTYDVCVPDLENLVVNGFVVHNSRIEQACDKWFSLWRPWVTNGDQKTVKIGYRTYDMSENLLVIRKLKERFNSPRFTEVVHFDPRYIKLAELETEVEEPPPLLYP